MIPFVSRDRRKERMKKKIMVWSLVFLMLLGLAGCKEEKDQQKQTVSKTEVREQLEVFQSGDMEQINALLFAEQVREDGYGWYPQQEHRGEGFLGDLFAMTKTKVDAMEEGTAVLKITAPDMSRFFTSQAQELSSVTDPQVLRQQLLSYASDAEQVTTEVRLPYSVEDGQIQIDYCDPEFIDAMTGGLVSAYGALYDQMMEVLGDVG